MSSFYSRLEEFISNGKNLNKIIFFLVVFLFAVNLPSIIISDIQPWDEGMYATRVLSIHTHGDFIDQSSHSVGNFYSGSHPPLLIWIGYLATIIFGISPVVLKLIPLVFGILCVILILLIGRKLYDNKIGFFAALIFCSNIIFNVFSKRFQFDIPYTFFILLSFYTLLLFNETSKYKYIILSGISFGLCLMVKILVGFYIPIVLFLSYIFIKDKVNFRFKDLIILTVTGIIIALPWHLYMLLNYGSEFLEYFFKFHIYDRAFLGVEMNEKRSGIFFHVNYLLSIIPYSILVLFSFVRDFVQSKKPDWKKVFLWSWFLTGLFIITVFQTKLEVYILLILAPASFIIPLYIGEIDKENLVLKTLIILFTFLNIFWFATEPVRPEIKSYVAANNKLFFLFIVLSGCTIIYFISKLLAKTLELKKTYYIFILIFFFTTNLYYLINITEWKNNFRISEIRNHIHQNSGKKILYIGTNYRYNPQFSFYFKGLNLNWDNHDYEFEFIDTKDGIDKTKEKVRNLTAGRYFLIVEKDYINRAEYPNSDLFIPSESKLIIKQTGYELYEN